jgi:malonyl-CoA O-methyltransferase
MNAHFVDKTHVRRSFARAARTYDTAAVLQREIADRLLERLDLIRLQPQRVLDLGCGTGHALTALQRRYPKAQRIALDFAQPMLLQARRRGHWWRRPLCICGDAEALPLASATVDLIVSNATLQWCDLARAVAECRRVLRPGGLLLFTTFGRETLGELRQAWAQVDGHTHVSPFLDLHDVGDALVQARFADPVVDVERLTLTYHRLRDLMLDLKTLGAHNATLTRQRGLTGRARFAAVAQAYELHRSAGSLPASYEVVYGHAWAPDATTASARQQFVGFPDN